MSLRFRLLLASAAWLAAALMAPAAPLTRDLGAGLTLYRPHALPDDLPSAARPSSAIVLDLRYLPDQDHAPAALAAWLHFQASPAHPVFVLLNDATGAALRRAFTVDAPRNGVITLAPAGDRFAPDISVSVSDDTDRRAYEALEHGAELDQLLTTAPGKPRRDEAALVQERLAPTPVEDDDASAPDASAPSQAAPPAPPADFVLLRAIQLHRGLQALKKM